jgi:hypothetical protein
LELIVFFASQTKMIAKEEWCYHKYWIMTLQRTEPFKRWWILDC